MIAVPKPEVVRFTLDGQDIDAQPGSLPVLVVLSIPRLNHDNSISYKHCQ